MENLNIKIGKLAWIVSFALTTLFLINTFAEEEDSLLIPFDESSDFANNEMGPLSDESEAFVNDEDSALVENDREPASAKRSRKAQVASAPVEESESNSAVQPGEKVYKIKLDIDAGRRFYKLDSNGNPPMKDGKPAAAGVLGKEYNGKEVLAYRKPNGMWVVVGEYGQDGKVQPSSIQGAAFRPYQKEAAAIPKEEQSQALSMGRRMAEVVKQPSWNFTPSSSNKGIPIEKLQDDKKWQEYKAAGFKEDAATAVSSNNKPAEVNTASASDVLDDLSRRCRLRGAVNSKDCLQEYKKACAKSNSDDCQYLPLASDPAAFQKEFAKCKSTPTSDTCKDLSKLGQTFHSGVKPTSVAGNRDSKELGVKLPFDTTNSPLMDCLGLKGRGDKVPDKCNELFKGKDKNGKDITAEALAATYLHNAKRFNPEGVKAKSADDWKKDLSQKFGANLTPDQVKQYGKDTIAAAAETPAQAAKPDATKPEAAAKPVEEKPIESEADIKKAIDKDWLKISEKNRDAIERKCAAAAANKEDAESKKFKEQVCKGLQKALAAEMKDCQGKVTESNIASQISKEKRCLVLLNSSCKALKIKEENYCSKIKNARDYMKLKCESGGTTAEEKVACAALKAGLSGAPATSNTKQEMPATPTGSESEE